MELSLSAEGSPDLELLNEFLAPPSYRIVEARLGEGDTLELVLERRDGSRFEVALSVEWTRTSGDGATIYSLGDAQAETLRRVVALEALFAGS